MYKASHLACVHLFAAHNESGDSTRSGSGHSTPKVSVTSLPPGFVGDSNDGNDITIEGIGFTKVFIALGTKQFYIGTPLLRQFGSLSIQENLVMTSAYVHPYVQTLEEWERRGREFEKSLSGRWKRPFLAGNRASGPWAARAFLGGKKHAPTCKGKKTSTKPNLSFD